jgi:hypothetical protein
LLRAQLGSAASSETAGGESGEVDERNEDKLLNDMYATPLPKLGHTALGNSGSVMNLSAADVEMYDSRAPKVVGSYKESKEGQFLADNPMGK